MPQKHETLRWIGDERGELILLDQTRLPVEVHELVCPDVETVWEAIKSLRVRGAPAIGIAAAYGVVLGLQPVLGIRAAAGQLAGHSPESWGGEPLPPLPHEVAPKKHPLTRPEVAVRREDFVAELARVTDYLASSRPTAVNLFWALDRMKRVAQALGDLPPHEIHRSLLSEAREIHAEDRRMCHAIGRYGAALFADGSGVLTHCNAGGLATSEYGTALSAFFTAQDAGKTIHVFVDETRPLLQGARLTAWELAQRGIRATLICDSMAAQVMREGKVQAVLVGADRIAANGDTANKIGTYSVACLAAAHGIPFYVAAPTSTFDLTLPNGAGIPIEQRNAEEITHGFGKQTAPEGVDVYNPAFDVTPAELIKAIVTERGVIEPVTAEHIAQMLG